MATVRWPHVELSLAHWCEQREIAFNDWRKSGYRDMGAHNRFLFYRDAVMHTNTFAMKYQTVESL